MSGTPLKILVLAHDLSDAAIHRRIAMLQMGGASITVAGFRRTDEPIKDINGCSVVNFGQTQNANFIQRSLSVLREIFFLNRHRALFANADVILARNLEMLAIAVRGQKLTPMRPMIAYEVLDIHRLMLGQNPISACLRALEGYLSQNCKTLITSSPAFIENYFEKLSQVKLPVHIIENKVLKSQNLPAPNTSTRKPGTPWIIGWYGIIRCKKSLHILRDLVRENHGVVEVVIRGRPALDQVDDFYETLKNQPGLRYEGQYTYPHDLKGIYGDAHFSWAIDMYEEGQNSAWLLPNRLYEGCYYGSVPLAIENGETSKFLNDRSIGVVLKQPLLEELKSFFTKLTPPAYQSLEEAIQHTPRATWVYDEHDCHDLVEDLRTLAYG